MKTSSATNTTTVTPTSALPADLRLIDSPAAREPDSLDAEPVNDTPRTQSASDLARADGGDGIFRLYLREMGQFPLLTREEEIELTRRVRQGDAVAREQMIKANLRLVVKIASEYKDYGMALLDLISEGNIALMKAVDRFDPARGLKFAAYAGIWIRQRVCRAVANQSRTVRIPVPAQAQLFKINRATAKLRGLLEREPTDTELSQETGLPETKVNRLRTAALSTVSLDAPSGEDDSRCIADTLADERQPTPRQHLEDEGNAELLQERIEELPPREQAILRYCFGLDGDDERTLEDIGHQFGVRRETVRKLQNLALKRLRKKMQTQEVTHRAA